jgi:hypothetical protein
MEKTKTVRNAAWDWFVQNAYITSRCHMAIDTRSDEQGFRLVCIKT